MLGLGLLSDESSLCNPAPPGRLTQIVISPSVLIKYLDLKLLNKRESSNSYPFT